MKIIALILCCLALPACETCREHPTACAVALSVAAGCAAASAWHSNGGVHMPDVTTQPVNCRNGACQ